MTTEEEIYFEQQRHLAELRRINGTDDDPVRDARPEERFEAEHCDHDGECLLEFGTGRCIIRDMVEGDRCNDPEPNPYRETVNDYKAEVAERLNVDIDNKPSARKIAIVVAAALAVMLVMTTLLWLLLIPTPLDLSWTACLCIALAARVLTLFCRWRIWQ
jgi:hypothetical protein